MLAHLAAQVLVRKRRDTHLGIEARTDVLDVDEPAADGDNRNDPDDEQDDLSVVVDIEHRRQYKEQDLHAHHGGKTALDVVRVTMLKRHSMIEQLATVRIGIEHDAHSRAQRIALARQVVGFANHKTRRGKLPIKEQVEVEQQRTQLQTNKERNDKEDAQDAQVEQVVERVHAADGLAQQVDAIGKGQQRMQPLEEAGHHLDGIHARRARDLHNDEDDADSFTDMLKGSGQRIDDVDVGERDGDAAQHKEQRIDALNANDQITHGNDDGLEGTQNHQQQPAAKVALARRKGTDALAVDLELVNGDEHVAAHPKRQVGIEGGNARTKALDRVNRLGGQLDRRCHKVGNVIDVDAHQLRQIAHGLRGLQRRDVVSGGCKLVLDLGKRGIGLGQGGLGLAERGVELRKRAARTCNGGREARYDTRQVARDGGKGIECTRGLRQRVLAQVCLGLAKVVRTGLDCVIDSVTGTRDSRSVIRHGARLRGQTVLDALQLLILLAERIDGRHDKRINVLGAGRRVVGKDLEMPNDSGVVIDRSLKRLE